MTPLLDPELGAEKRKGVTGSHGTQTSIHRHTDSFYKLNKNVFAKCHKNKKNRRRTTTTYKLLDRDARGEKVGPK